MGQQGCFQKRTSPLLGPEKGFPPSGGNLARDGGGERGLGALASPGRAGPPLAHAHPSFWGRSAMNQLPTNAQLGAAISENSHELRSTQDTGDATPRPAGRGYLHTLPVCERSPRAGRGGRPQCWRKLLPVTSQHARVALVSLPFMEATSCSERPGDPPRAPCDPPAWRQPCPRAQPRSSCSAPWDG